MSSVRWDVRLRIERYVRENAEDSPRAERGFFAVMPPWRLHMSWLDQSGPGPREAPADKDHRTSRAEFGLEARAADLEPNSRDQV
jgi:hypothetical protein